MKISRVLVVSVMILGLAACASSNLTPEQKYERDQKIAQAFENYSENRKAQLERNRQQMEYERTNGVACKRYNDTSSNPQIYRFQYGCPNGYSEVY